MTAIQGVCSTGLPLQLIGGEAGERSDVNANDLGNFTFAAQRSGVFMVPKPTWRLPAHSFTCAVGYQVAGYLARAGARVDGLKLWCGKVMPAETTGSMRP